MPKKVEELSALKVKRLSEPGKYAVGGVPGLMLRITETGAKGWVLRTSIAGKRVDAGLGGYPEIGLSDARDNAREFRAKVKQGIDPLEERKQAREVLIKKRATSISFEQAARDCHAVKAQEFKNPKHADQWINTLAKYVFPIIGDRPATEIRPADCLEVLKPIWTEVPETASRVRQRMATVFDYTSAAGIRSDSNPAAWKGCLEPLLPAIAKVKKQQGRDVHYPSLPYKYAPGFSADLASRKTISANAVQVLTLLAVRSNEIRFAQRQEFDFVERVWKIPADRMKAGKEHKVPLSPLVIELIQKMFSAHSHNYVWPSNFGENTGKPLSDATLARLIKTMHEKVKKNGGIGYFDPEIGRIATPHGMRATFKEWARQQRDFADEVSELQLAHVSTDATRAAYARDALLEQRREMMLRWEQYLLNQ